MDPQRIVIELTEQYPMDNYALVREAKNHYKQMGFEIAIDDLGAGYAGLRMWSELRPDYVKIDRHFVQDIHTDLIKQEFVRSIQDIARSMQCRVIAEGVETLDEFRVVKQLGIDMLQGYYFARPSNTPASKLNRELFEDDKTHQTCRSSSSLFSKTVGGLSQQVPTINAGLSVEAVAELFAADPQLESLPVLEHGRPLGMVRRRKLMNLLLTRYGRELHGKKSIVYFMEHQVLMLEASLPIEQASSQVGEHMRYSKELDFLITEAGMYRGIGSVINLLQVITDLQVRSARYANPLTLLPGNVPIYEEIERCLESASEFSFCYCDLDNFKPFNDHYGYEKGDQVIRRVAEILLSEINPETDFVGHIGGDDYVLILHGEDWQVRCEAILASFQQRLSDFYQPEELVAGGIWALDRAGKDCFFPLLSLSIGCVRPDLLACQSHHDVAALAAGAKHQAKKIPGTSLYLDQRRCPDKPAPHEVVAA